MKRFLPFVVTYVLLVLCMPSESGAQGGGVGLNWARSAHLAGAKTLDFRINTTHRGFSKGTNTVLSTGDTVRLGAKGNLTDIQWRLSYGLSRRMEFNVSGVTMVDRQAGASRYGIGDTKVSLRFGTGNETSPINLCTELYYIIPMGFNEGTRLIRQFSLGHGSPGANLFTTFRMTRVNAHINLGYNYNGGIIEKLPERENAYYYPVLDGSVGIDTDTRIYTSSQVNMVFGGDLRLFGKFFVFGEYSGRELLAQKGDHQSLGVTTVGISYVVQGSWQFKAGYFRPSSTMQPDAGFLFEVRLNDVFGRVRSWEPPPKLSSALLPALKPARKPFFRKDNTLFASAKEPVHDTVFLVDVSPSMMGWGLVSIRGENILSELPNFTNGVLDEIPKGSNISLITFSNTVKSLSWGSVTEDKKEDIQRFFNDIPDEASALIRQISAQPESYPTVEDLLGGMTRAYQELERFKKGDYNRIHLQRIILITDDIPDDSVQVRNYTQDFEQLRRRFNVNNQDFRLFYYLLTNRTPGKTVPQHIINFTEREDGGILRDVDPNQKEEVIPRLNYNQKDEQESFKFLSQLTKIAVVPFKTKGKAIFGDELTKAFKSIFENNAYFMLSEQNEVDRLLQISGLDMKERVSVTEAQKLGKQLGVDFVVIGEIKNYRLIRDKGLYFPHIAGLPKTEIQMSIAVDMIDVANGSIAYAEVIDASEDMSRGFNIFAGNRIDRTNYLSSLDKDKLRQNLLASWRRNVITGFFQDITTLQKF